MNKILIIIQREFLKRVQKKSFILLTLATPFLMAALICVPLWLSSMENDTQQHVAVVDPSGVYVKALQGSPGFCIHRATGTDQGDAGRRLAL